MPIADKKTSAISDYVVLFFIGAILAIDFLPYFKTIEIINPQFFYLSIINILMGLYFYFRHRDIVFESFSVFRKSFLTYLYLIFLFLCCLSVFKANNISLFLTSFTEILIVFLLFINLTILLKDKLSLFYKIAFIIGIFSFLQSLQELNSLLVASNRSTLIEGLSAMKGNTGSINILAASLSIKIPFLFLGITHYMGYKKWFLSFTLFLTITIILLTGARTPLITLSLVFIIYILYYLKIHSFKKESFIKCSLLIIPVIFSLFIANVVFEKSKDNQNRYASITKNIERIDVQEESAQIRLSMWDNAFKLFQTSPVLGIGLGNYRIESIPYEKTKTNDTITYLHTHNDFLEILSETGIVNGLIYFSLFVFVFFVNIKKIIKSEEEISRTVALVTLLVAIIYGIDSLFNFPMYRPTMQIFVSIIFALTVVNNSSLINSKIGDSKKNLNFYPVVFVLCIITCYSAFQLYKASNLEYLIKTDNINVNTSGVLNGDEVINRLPLYPNVFGTSESFYEYAGIYYFREKNYDQALRCFDMGYKINPYLGRIDFYRYLLYKEKGDIDNAYTYAKKAFYLKPRNRNFYEQSINTAAVKKDTLEILKEHKLFIKYRNIPEAWKHAALGLQTTGYTTKKLIVFLDEGLKTLPGDKVLLKQKNDFMITDLIVEGQKFYSEGNPDKSLESYTKALKIDPENIYAMQNIGFHYYNHGQYKKAIGYFQNALKSPGLNGGHTEYYIAMSYLLINDMENSCKYFNISQSKGYTSAQQQIDQHCKLRH